MNLNFQKVTKSYWIDEAARRFYNKNNSFHGQRKGRILSSHMEVNIPAASDGQEKDKR